MNCVDKKLQKIFTIDLMVNKTANQNINTLVGNIKAYIFYFYEV